MKNKNLARLSALSLLLIIAACGGGNQDKSKELAKLKDEKAKIEAQITALEKEIGASAPAEQRIKTVGVTEVQPTTFRHFIDLQGKIEAENIVPVTSKMPGSITRILVKNGDNVRKGQLIAQLDDEVMAKGLAELDLQLRTAQDIFQRQKGLWDQRIGTEIQYIQAKTQVEALEQRISTTKEQMGQSKIYAPIAGTVDNVLLKTGQAISPGYPLCSIVNMGDLKVRGEVTEAYASKVKPGDQVQVMFPDLKKEITTRVTYVSRTINPTSRTFTVECSLPSTADYRANMVAVMKIIDYQKAGAFVLPVNLIQTAEDGDFVLVAEKTGDKQGKAKKVTIKQGSNYNGEVEILNGLNKGDAVISTGYQDVNNGETINF